MDVVNISRSRRFLRERPMHVNLFDRPRVVVDLLCLEAGQEESRTGFERSDSLLVLIEGEARLRAGPQIESLQEMDAVLVPPGQDYVVANTGAGQMMALVMVAPKPTRAGEVRVPGDTRPFRNVRPDREVDEPAGIARRTPPRRPPGASDGPRREMPGARQGRPYRPEGPPERRPYPRRPAEASGRPAYPRRDNGGDRPAYPRRDSSEGRSAYPRRDSSEGRSAYPRRDSSEGRPAYPRRDNAPPDERGGPRRGTTGARAPRRDDGEGPAWYPKPKPAWRPRGAPPAAGGRGRPPARSTGPRNAGAPGRPRTGEASSEGGAGRTGATRSYGPPRARTGGGYSGGAARGRSSGGYPGDRPGGNRAGGAPRGGSGGAKKTGAARKASRGQGPQTGHRGPGRSGPTT